MKFYCTSLHWAASKGNCELGELLIGEGAAVEVKDEVSKRFIGTIIYFMTFCGVSLLIKVGYTPFLMACSCQQFPFVELLISKGCNIHAKSNVRFFTNILPLTVDCVYL